MCTVSARLRSWRRTTLDVKTSTLRYVESACVLSACRAAVNAGRRVELSEGEMPRQTLTLLMKGSGGGTRLCPQGGRPSTGRELKRGQNWRNNVSMLRNATCDRLDGSRTSRRVRRRRPHQTDRSCTTRLWLTVGKQKATSSRRSRWLCTKCGLHLERLTIA